MDFSEATQSMSEVFKSQIKPSFVTNQTDNWAQDAFDGILGMGFQGASAINSTPYSQRLINNGEVAE
jgi:hypothetical protein